MKAERWPAVERLYHGALERGAEERAAFLSEACGSDDELRREVESLLAYEVQAKDFIENPALEVAGEIMADRQHSLVTGQALNHYTILELRGAPGGHHSSRHQAREHHDSARWHRESTGLRSGQTSGAAIK